MYINLDTEMIISYYLQNVLSLHIIRTFIDTSENGRVWKAKRGSLISPSLRYEEIEIADYVSRGGPSLLHDDYTHGRF